MYLAKYIYSYKVILSDHDFIIMNWQAINQTMQPRKVNINNFRW